MMRKKNVEKEKRACGFFRVHVDNTLSRARYPRPRTGGGITHEHGMEVRFA